MSTPAPDPGGRPTVAHPAPWPPQALRVPATTVLRPRSPVISIHEHLGPVFGGDWALRPVSELLDAMDEAGIMTMVDLDGGQGDELSRQVERYQVPHPERIIVFAGLDYGMWSREADFGELEAERLRDSVARGARGLKVWKLLGLRACDTTGRLVAVDDERLDPLWRAVADLRLPVVIHVADPIAFFEPVGEGNERTEELALHPDWHFWPPMETADGPGFPRFDDVLAAFDRLLGRHPDVTFIGAHVGCAAEDLALVDGLLERHPNLCVDIADRIAELGRQPYSARRFLLRWADRVLFGTDSAVDVATCRIYYRFLETFDESFDYSPREVPPQGRWRISGLGLPDEVLRLVYADNARRVLGLGGAG
ncbi:MAG: amidohydrolase family protein [Chloroflexi bacterium]|nr:amidohydrolase family protein [Chloroflexota bacterium]